MVHCCCEIDFIANTGIAKLREFDLEQEERKSVKQRQREQARPKSGRIEINYQVLHDAFFRYQTKPKMTRHGDLYYEGKEFKVTVKNKTPGHLSDELKVRVVSHTDAVGFPPLLLLILVCVCVWCVYMCATRDCHCRRHWEWRKGRRLPG